MAHQESSCAFWIGWETSFRGAKCASYARHDSASLHFDRALLSKSSPPPPPQPSTPHLHCKLDVHTCSAKSTGTRHRFPPLFMKLFKDSQDTNECEEMSCERHSVVDLSSSNASGSALLRLSVFPHRCSCLIKLEGIFFLEIEPLSFGCFWCPGRSLTFDLAPFSASQE